MSGNRPSLNELGRPLLAPPILVLEVLCIIHFSGVLSLFAKNKNTNAPPFEVPSSERADATETTRTEIQSVSSSWREIRRLLPEDGEGEDLVQ